MKKKPPQTKFDPKLLDQLAEVFARAAVDQVIAELSGKTESSPVPTVKRKRKKK